MVKTLVWSVVLYGSETWTPRKDDIKRLEAFEKDGESQLGGEKDKQGSLKDGGGTKISDRYYTRTAEEMDRTHLKE